jgi:tetratricopeptide (TPR) repeat protein
MAEAREDFARAKAREGGSRNAIIREGYFLLVSGDRAGAKEDFESVIAADTSSAVGYHHMASLMSARGDERGAEASLRRALELEKADPKTSAADELHTLGRLGELLLTEGRAEEAIAVYRECLGKPLPNRLFADCIAALGGVYASAGRQAEAEAAFRAIAEVCKDGPGCSCRAAGSIGLGSAYLLAGRKSEAAAAAAQAEALCRHAPSPDRAMDLAALETGLGRPAKAEALYRQALREHGRNPWVLQSLAELETAQGRPSDAERDYRAAIAFWTARGDESKARELTEALRRREAPAEVRASSAAPESRP